MRELHLFAGAGGGILGGMLLGHTTVCAVEIEPYCRRVLLQRQRDGILPKFPIWDDITTFDGNPWRGRVDIVCGGFPCQDISAAGKGAGINGARSGLWGHMARVVCEVRPSYVFVENSPMLTSRGLGRVLGDLASMGYDAKWCVLGADDAGAPHRRKRIWILANAAQLQRDGGDDNTGIGPCSKQVSESGDGCGAQNLADTDEIGRHGRPRDKREQDGRGKLADGGENVAYATGERQPGQGQSWYASDPAEAREGETDRAWAERVGHVWGIESRLGRVAHGVAHRVDRLKAIGNGQVPQCAALAWRTLSGL